MSVPSYDDLTPPIPDVLSSEHVAQLELFLQTIDGGADRAARASRPGALDEAGVASAAAPVALYACVQGEPAQVAALLSIARDFSPRVMQAGPRDILLDVSGLGRLIGEPETIAAALDRAVRSAGSRAVVAIAPTHTAARLLCSAGAPDTARPGRPRVVVADAAAAIARLPVTVLQPLEVLPPAINVRDRARPYATFESWGMATLGDLAALPAADLASRLGRRGAALQRLARGLDARPFVPDGETPRYRERLELDWPIDGLEPLSFVLARLLDPLSLALERADRGAAAVHLDLRLTDRSTHARVLQLPAPMRDARVLRTLLLLDLESHPPSAAIDIADVELDPAPARVTQFSLLQRALPSPEALSTLTARLSALAGETRVGAPGLVDTHRPGAFEMRRFAPDAAPAAASSDTAMTAPGDVMIRRQRLPPAIRVTVERGRPVFLAASRRGLPSGAVTQAAGPWRASGGWWRDARKDVSVGRPPEPADRAELTVRTRTARPARERPRATEPGGGAEPHVSWNRDEWDVALASGAICRIYQDRSTGRWFLDGVYD